MIWRSNVKSAVKKIKSVEVQGAKQIALFGLRFLRGYARRHGFGKDFMAAARELEKARPTAVVLHNCLEIVRKEKTLKSIDELIANLKNFDYLLAAQGLREFKKKEYVIMSHCHSGEALGVIKMLKRHGRKIKVITTETDPLEQGVKTAKELAKAKIHVTLIVDSAVGHFMKDVDMVMVGTDALRKEGVVNKIGTSLYAIAAKEYKKPVYIVGNSLKIDKREKFQIEERPADEVYRELVKPGRLTGVKIRNPAFDITPWKYVTKVVTEAGRYTPKEIKNIIRRK
jgi:ribose 1,5-bisphosphate isomerase